MNPGSLPWLVEPLRRILSTQRAHALLLQGQKGVGEFELAIDIAKARLCESDDVPVAMRPCGRCAGCHLVDAHAHPDLLVLLPEALREPLGWQAADDGEGAGDRASKAKPSRDIKVEAIRVAIAFAQTTAARGRAKVLVVHPAERMNSVAANALLKTLEEPPGATRFVLCSSAPDALLPTIRSRCQPVAIALPSEAQASAWLVEQGVASPSVLLAGSGGQPQEVLVWRELGVDASIWSRLPAAVRSGDPAPFKGWPLALVVDTLQKLCHDALCLAVGATPRYFPIRSIAAGARLPSLLRWARELQTMARHADHPVIADLAIESVVQQGGEALNTPRPAGRDPRSDSLHSS